MIVPSALFAGAVILSAVGMLLMLGQGPSHPSPRGLAVLAHLGAAGIAFMASPSGNIGFLPAILGVTASFILHMRLLEWQGR